MNKLTGILLILLVTISLLQAQSPAQEAQPRAKAYRAAKMDAIRQLSEKIQGVRISSQTTVRDFVTEKDEIRTGMETLLQGARQVGEPRYNADGTVEVDMEVSLDQVIIWLQRCWYQYGSRRIACAEQLQYIHANCSQKVFKATGSGAMSQKSTGQARNVWNRVTPRGKLTALRAAQVDAYRNLAEAIQGIRVNSATTIKDFVTESDEIRSKFNCIVRGAQFVGKPIFRPEGVVEVKAQIDLYRLFFSLAKICRRHSCSRWFAEDFENLKNSFSRRYIYAVGTGVPPDKYMLPEPPAPFIPQPSLASPAPALSYIPKWAIKTIRVTGRAAIFANDSKPGQAQLNAIRGAQLDAYRQLVEQVFGLRLDANTSVRDFVTEMDVINTQTSVYLRGARVTATRIVGDGTVEVDMSLYLGDIWRLIQRHYRRR